MRTIKKKNFFNVCKKGNIKQVKKMLLLDLDFNLSGDFGVTPFSIACEEGHKKVVEILLQDGRIDVNKVDNEGQTPFYWTCCIDNKEMMRILLQNSRIDVNKQNNNGLTAFAKACLSGKTETVELLLQDPRIDVNKPNNNGITAFSFACENKQKETVELLLQNSCIDLSKILTTSQVSDSAYNYLCHALCSAGNKILKPKDFSEIKSVSKISAIISNIKIAQNQNMIIKILSEQLIKDLKEKLRILEPALDFTMMVLVTDGYVKVKPYASDGIKRFFEIAQQLPMEIQIKIAQQIVHDEQDSTILSSDVEWASKSLFLSFGEEIQAIGETS